MPVAGAGDEGWQFTLSPDKDKTYTKLENEIWVIVDGDLVEWADTVPYQENGCTMVPLHTVAEAMNLETLWNQNTKTAKVTGVTSTFYGDAYIVSVSFTLNSRTLSVEYTAKSTQQSVIETVQMNAAPVSKGSHTYVPIRYLAEQFGYSISWEQSTKTITIEPGTIDAPEFPSSSIPDGRYNVRVYKNRISTDSTGNEVVNGEVLKAVQFSDDYVQSLNVGDTISLSHYGLSDMYVSRLSKSDNEVWISDYSYFWKSDQEWILTEYDLPIEYVSDYADLRLSKDTIISDEYTSCETTGMMDVQQLTSLQSFFSQNRLDCIDVIVNITNGKVAEVTIPYRPA